MRSKYTFFNSTEDCHLIYSICKHLTGGDTYPQLLHNTTNIFLYTFETNTVAVNYNQSSHFGSFVEMFRGSHSR